VKGKKLINKIAMYACVVAEKFHSHPMHGRLLEIPRGKGVLKAKILEAMNV